MSEYLAPTQEMQFVLEQIAGLEEVAKLPGYEEATPDMVQAILEEAGKFAAEALAPLNVVGDQQGAKLVDGKVKEADGFAKAYAEFVENGWASLSGSVDFDGQGLPKVVGTAVDEMWQTANLAFSLCPMLTHGSIDAVQHHGSDAQKALYLPRLISGQWTGTMNLTEPQAGSDLSVVRCKAVPNGDHYLISGQKIFITWGDHEMAENVIHLVLARTPDAPAGTRGISLFIVPKFMVDADGNLGERNDAYAVSLEHKMGIHASPTCVMSFGDNGGAVGYLVGEENKGLAYMFTMMNNARLNVGLQGVSISERAYQLASAYAEDRVQGGVPIIQHPDVKRMLLLMKTQTEAARMLAYRAFAHMDFAERSDDVETRKRNQAWVDLLTPIVKAWITEMAQEVTSLGVQVHGGMGFIEETGAAQYMRDARIIPIYEGTTTEGRGVFLHRRCAQFGY
jgi:alkylation response protein AidB-like acyl-CoA dehydrogenase